MTPRLFLIDQGLVTLGGHHAEYNFSIAQAAERLGLSPVLIVNQAYRAVEEAAFPVFPIFSCAWHNLARPGLAGTPDPAAAVAPYTFASELCAALGHFRAGPADHVFIHSVGFLEAEELLHLFITRDPASLPFVHFLMRRDIDEIAGNAEAHAAFLRSIRRLRDAGAFPSRIAFYTDTQELTDSYSTATGVRFRTLPIPFRHELIDSAAAALPSRAPGEAHAFTFLYLGDARTEKGYHLLPGLARALYHRGTHAARPGARLVAQSNFNTPGGEPRPRVARNQLTAFPPDVVELHETPLAPDRYYALLSGCDAVVIPYDAECYKRRSSGVFAEALAAGKPVVIPAGTSMASALPDGCGVVYEGESGFVRACIDALDRGDELSLAARAGAGAWRSLHSPDVLVRGLLDTAAAAASAPEPAPFVLVVLDAESLYYKIGAGETNLSQLRFLQASGYRVGVLALVHHYLDQSEGDFSQAEWVRRCNQATDGLGVAYCWVASYATPVDLDPIGLEADLRRRSTLAIPASLREFLATHRVDCVYLNYAQNLPALAKLAIPDVPVLCEAHDVQAFQYAIARRQTVDPAELRHELAIYQRFAATVFVNEIETSRAAGLAPGLRTFTARPVSYDAPLSPADLAGPVDPAELLSSCGSELEDVDIERAWASNRLTQVNRLFEETSLDLLFVGAHHIPNRLALDWFFHQVFVPYLAPHAINLVVAGTIATQRADFEHTRVFWTGKVRTLRPLYAAAKAVVLPITDGAGFNMKTMQALGLGKPVVATGLALRGMGPDAADFATFDDPEAFARRVLELVRSPGARDAASRESRKVARSLRDLAGHYAQRFAAFRTVLGERALPAPPAPPEPDWHTVEWSPDVRLCNEAIRLLLTRQPCPPVMLDRFEAFVATEQGRGMLRAIVDALFVTRDAPSLATGQAAYAPIASWSGFASATQALAALCARAMPPGSFIPPAAPEAFAGCQTLAEVLSACGSDRDDVDLESAWSGGRLAQVQRTEQAQAIHAVALADASPASRAGLESFVREVFLPQLAPHGITLAIAGPAPAADWLDHPSIFLAGKLANPWPLVSAAHVVVHPIAPSGAFGPRTLWQVAPTLTSDKPVVGTSAAFWFLSDEDRADLAFDAPGALARRIRQLLSARETRRLQAAATRRALDSFRRALAPIAREAGSLMLEFPAPRAGEPALCEWSDDDVLIGRLVQKVLLGSPVFDSEFKGLKSGAAREATRRRWEDALRSVFTDRSAPILRTSHVTFARLPAAGGDLGSIDGFIARVEPLVEA